MLPNMFFSFSGTYLFNLWYLYCKYILVVTFAVKYFFLIWKILCSIRFSWEGRGGFMQVTIQSNLC